MLGMAKKDKRFELRLTAQEIKALDKLALKRGQNRSELVAAMLKRAAQQAKCWE